MTDAQINHAWDTAELKFINAGRRAAESLGWGAPAAPQTEGCPSVMKYRCEDMRPVKAESARKAAKAFAARMGRREYGRNGHCRSLRLDCWTESGSSHTFEAFIGRPVPGENATSGRNVWLTVTREEV